MEVSWHRGHVVGQIYLFHALRNRFAFLRLIASLFRMGLGHVYSNLVGALCCQLDVSIQLITLLEYSYRIRMCECHILRNLVPSKMSRACSEVGCCVKGVSLFFSFHIGIMPKLKDSFTRRQAVIFHSTQFGT